jgi:hypothetical protein
MTIIEWQECYAVAERLKLSGWELLKDRERCLEECNGIGAGWMPEWLRMCLGVCLELFKPAAAIHDLRYSMAKLDRWKCDAEFEENCRALARDEYSAWNPLRYVCYLTAKRLRFALIIAGGTAYGRNE